MVVDLGCIKSGLYRGFASMIDGIVEHVITAWGDKTTASAPEDASVFGFGLQ
jgi:hypothetical protein